MKKALLIFTLFALILTVLPGAALAQEPVDCGEDYTVQAGDWLSKIADKYFGDVLSYYAIAYATNMQTGDDYAQIDSVDVIEPGWTLCIPAETDLPNLLAQSIGVIGESTVRAAVPTLTGTLWVLTALNGESIPAEVTATADFSPEGTVSGSSGCNTYNSTYQTDGDSISFGPGMTTLMMCADPQMQVETGLMAAYSMAAGYQVAGNTLTLLDADGNAVAEFTASKPVALAGSSWQVTSYNNGNEAVVSVLNGTELTANFGADGSLGGSAGCNNYTTSYQTDGDSISIGPAASTMMMCAEPEGIMEQEIQFLTALGTANTYSIELDRMEMRTADGALVADFQLIEAESATEAAADAAQVSGTITYLPRIALPDDAVINVQVQDTSLADAPAVVMGEQIIETNGQQVPFDFAVSYNPAELQDGHTYTLRVRIEDSQGNLLFINTTSIPVITNSNPTSDIEVIVDPV